MYVKRSTNTTYVIIRLSDSSSVKTIIPELIGGYLATRYTH